VKVQRPDVEEAVTRDGRVLRWGAGVLERRWEHFSSLGISALADELVGSVESELDFTREQANNAAMRAARSGDPGVRFPEILPSLTTQKVLVMDEVDGVEVSDAAAVDATGRPRSEIADNLLRTFLAQALTDGRFHADPHPGNVMIDATGDLWLIDYGAVGTIDPITLEALQLLAAGFLMQDATLAARAVRRMVGPQGTQLDIAALETDMAMLLGQFTAGGIDPEIIGSVVQTLARFGVAAPPALTVLGRAALTLDGTLGIIDPDFQMGARSQEHLSPLAAGELSNPRDILTKELVRALPSLRSLPMLSEDLGLQARDGLLTVRTERYRTGDEVQVSSWIDHVLFATLAMVGFLGSGLLLLAGAIAEGEESARFLYGLGFSGLLLSVTAMLRSVAQLREPRRGRPRR